MKGGAYFVEMWYIDKKILNCNNYFEENMRILWIWSGNNKIRGGILYGKNWSYINAIEEK